MPEHPPRWFTVDYWKDRERQAAAAFLVGTAGVISMTVVAATTSPDAIDVKYAPVFMGLIAGSYIGKNGNGKDE